jgi:hypothetical protein
VKIDTQKSTSGCNASGSGKVSSAEAVVRATARQRVIARNPLIILLAIKISSSFNRKFLINSQKRTPGSRIVGDANELLRRRQVA